MKRRWDDYAFGWVGWIVAEAEWRYGGKGRRWFQ